MKRIMLVITAVAAALLLNVAAVLAADESMGRGTEPQVTPQKDECLLVAKNCPTEEMTLYQRIDRLVAEIKKGTTVYTDAELGVLKTQLNDALAAEKARDINVYVP